MIRRAGMQFEEEVAESIKSLGYKVKRNTLYMPDHSIWQRGLMFALTDPNKYRVDILVERDDKFLVVETKRRVPSSAQIMHVLDYAAFFGTDIVICVPDELFSETTPNVREFAKANEVEIYSQSGIADVLQRLLG